MLNGAAPFPKATGVLSDAGESLYLLMIDQIDCNQVIPPNCRLI